MQNTISKSDTYSSLCLYANFHSQLVHRSVPVYFAVILPLIALGLDLADQGFSPAIKYSSITFGAVFSTIWWLRSARWSRWMVVALEQIRELEDEAGLTLGRGQIFKRGKLEHKFLGRTATSIGMTILLYKLGMILFVLLLPLEFFGVLS